MTTVYASYDAALVHTPAPKCECGEGLTIQITSLYGNVCELKRDCPHCGKVTWSAVFVNVRAKLLSQEETDILISARRAAGMTLKMISARTGITVSRLSDLERRHVEPQSGEIETIMSAIHEGGEG